MANRRVLVKRRKATQNIRKITRTMQLVATARFQAAFNRAVAARPYTEKLSELVADLARAGAQLEHPLLAAREPGAPEALVVITSNRGLAGSYNANVLRAAQALLEARRAAGKPVELHVFGAKGIAYFKFHRQALASQSIEIGDRPRFDRVEPVAQRLIEAFLAGRLSAVHVAYMRFHSVGQQRPEVFQLLPLVPAAKAVAAKPVEYEFMPAPQAILDELLPATARVRLFQSFIDGAVSEQVARMVAMKAATEAAEDMIKALSRQYNRARQSQITMELLDIVGGANALA
jgi:F-type H+-transporting ATPase subunit gamma